ncbi:neuronal acetylcholine receptor subunit alpha-6-like [Saccostrea echinata]|uniref:neuronal acetylcholine receptor subunit alpha-6-like n=1 Tax=Saccostrea echinata TaxID=191078 RepID=UPI002A82FD56|nr:neuronal acetylcholine receptor subunit alpha-6-like [Saccostrea echinata]
MKWIDYFILCLLFLEGSFSANITEVETLYDNLLNNYNKYVRPLTSTSTPVLVNATYSLVGIKEFDEVNGKFSVIGFFTITWIDPRLAWNPWLYNNIYMTELPESKVWIPSLTLVNPYDKIENLAKGLFPVTYVYNGLAYWSPGDVTSTGCEVDVTYYPFDTQSCSMMLMCWGYGPSAIITQASDPEIGMAYYSEHGTWELVDKKLSTHLDSFLSYISIDIKMKRRPTFAVINIVLPMVFMLVLNLLVFILPVDGGERVSYAITVLLAIAVFLTLVGDNLPKTSKPTALLSYFLLVDLVLSSLICFFVIIGMSFYYKDKKETPVPKPIANMVRLCCHRRCARRAESTTVVEAYDPKSSNKNVPFTDDDEEEEEVTWKMVSKCFDKFMLVSCLLIIIASTAAFFVMTM